GGWVGGWSVGGWRRIGDARTHRDHGLRDQCGSGVARASADRSGRRRGGDGRRLAGGRSEEHTSELQSRFDLVCRLLLEKKKSLSACGQRWNNPRIIMQDNDGNT